jgi:hypothetical protein
MATTPELERMASGVTLFRTCLILTEYPGVEAATKWLLHRHNADRHHRRGAQRLRRRGG